MPNLNDTQPNSPPARLEYAIQLAKSGQKGEARDILRQVVALQPVNQAAWLWLSAVATEQPEAEAALAQARKINPHHSAIPRAERWLARRFSSQSPTKVTPILVSQPNPAPPSVSHHHFGLFNSLGIGVVVIAIVLGLIVLLFGIFWEANATAQGQAPANPGVKIEAAAPQPPDLDIARSQRNWAEVIVSLERQLQQQPGNADIQLQLAQAYLQQGLELRYQDQLEAALISFEQAAQLNPQSNQVQYELELASYYQTGKRYYQNGDWPEAITALEAVYAEETTYGNVKDLLFSAYYNHGLALQAVEDLPGARETLTAAIALRPDLPEPRLHLAKLEYALAPETPPEIPVSTVPLEDRLIVVGIAEQRMQVYEGDKQIFDFIVSTGEPGRETAIGEFEIQNKIDMAYASTWNLDMPYWLGIYWAGPLQNGIHSLPTVKHTGQTLWDGYLGQRVSYGCVILGQADAATLYNWAEVGTKVKIVPSLIAWSLENN